MTPEPRCALVVRTGLPCGRKAVYAIGLSMYPVCAAHVAKELNIITKSLPVPGLVTSEAIGGVGTQVTLTRLVP